MILVSLRNRTAERRGRQNACVWQKWQGYYSCVLSWSSVKLMFSGLLQKDLFKEGCSSAEHFFKQNYCHACHTRFADSFPPPSSCVSSLLDKTGCEVDYAQYGCSHWLFWDWIRDWVSVVSDCTTGMFWRTLSLGLSLSLRFTTLWTC